jgi:hypothetical protein
MSGQLHGEVRDEPIRRLHDDSLCAVRREPLQHLHKAGALIDPVGTARLESPEIAFRALCCPRQA